MKTIGIKLADGSFYPVLEDNTPSEKKLELTTAHNNQTKVMVDLYRSATCSMDDAEYVDSLQIENLTARPNGETDIKFSISLDEDNQLSARIVDPETGNESNTTITLVSRTLEERLVTDDYAINDSEENSGAGAALAGAAAAGAISEAATTAAASEGAMKLAGVSGEIISEVVDDNIHKQSENLDRIDSSLVGTNPEAVEISAEAEAVGRLSASKIEQNDENDKKTEFAPKDLSKLNKVDTIASETKEQMFVHETVNMEEATYIDYQF